MENLRDFQKNLKEARVELIDLLRERSLLTDGPYTLRSGEVSQWYLDGRRTTMDGHGATVVGRAVLGVLDPTAGVVGGLTMGADPIAMATAVVAYQAGIPLRAFSVRKQAKAHGLGGRIVGPLEAGEPVAVLEDTTSTGGAFVEAILVMQNAGHVVVQAISVTDRSSGAVSKIMADLGIPYVALVTPEDLLLAP